MPDVGGHILSFFFGGDAPHFTPPTVWIFDCQKTIFLSTFSIFNK
jgi:hypothetical protein